MANKYRTDKKASYEKPVSKGVFPDETDELESMLDNDKKEDKKYLPESEN